MNQKAPFLPLESLSLHEQDDHGVSGFLFKNSELDSPETKKHRQKIYRQQLHYNLVLKSFQDRLGKLLSSINIKSVLLKGWALIDLLYSDPGLRSLSDIDLLIESTDLDQVKEVLKKEGFKEIAHRQWEGDDFKTIFSGEFCGSVVIVELHTEMFMFRGTIKPHLLPYGEGDFLQIAPTDLLVYLAGHLGAQHTFLKLSWLIDIILLLKKFARDLDFERIALLSRDWKFENSLAACVEAACLIDTDLKATYSGSFINSQSFNQKVLKRLLTMNFLLYPSKSRMRYLAIKHLLKDSVLSTLTYDWNWLKWRMSYWWRAARN